MRSANQRWRSNGRGFADIVSIAKGVAWVDLIRLEWMIKQRIAGNGHFMQKYHCVMVVLGVTPISAGWLLRR